MTSSLDTVLRVHAPQPGVAPVPLVLDSPHSGVHYPADFDHVVDRASLRDAEDTHVEQLFGFAPALGATLIEALFPRSYVDPNRAPDDIDLELIEGDWPAPVAPTGKSALGKSLVWRLLDDGRPIYDRRLRVDEVRQRIQRCWQPYHDTLAQAIERTHATFGFVLHLNCHSMPCVAGPYATDQPGLQHPDIVLGDRDGSSSDPRLTEWLRAAFAQRGYQVWVNDPYKGVELVRRYADPAAGRHSIQVEINRALYMDERTREPHPGFARLQADLHDIVRACAACLPGWIRRGPP